MCHTLRSEIMINQISTLQDLCELAKMGKDLLNKHFPSAAEKEILRSAAQKGEFYILQADQLTYPIIRAGADQMGDENDPASLAMYYDAFKQLCENGYIVHAGGALFRLTAGGFGKARKV